MELLVCAISKYFYVYGVACGYVVGLMGFTAICIGLTQYLTK